MQDLTKLNKSKLNDSKKSEALTKQPNWLTKNRFWNLAFLIVIPLELYLSKITNNFTLSFLIDALAMFTAFWIIDFSPKDLNTISKVEAKKTPYVDAVTSIFILSIAVCAVLIIPFGSKMLHIGLAPFIFFIFLVPVIILCYANIPLSHCFDDAKNSPKLHSIGSRASVGDSRVPYAIRSQNLKK